MKRKIRKMPLFICVLAVMCSNSAAAGSKNIWKNTRSQMEGIASVQNTFRVKTHNVIPIKSYRQYSYWLPGEAAMHEVQLCNIGDMDAVMRVKFEDEWKAADGSSLAERYEYNGVSKTMTEKNWTEAGIMNDALWQDGGDGYYYYKKVFKAGELTDKLLTEITLTDDRISDETGRLYASAKYTLNVAVEAMPVSSAGNENAISKVFGSGVTIDVNESEHVNWTFSR